MGRHDAARRPPKFKRSARDGGSKSNRDRWSTRRDRDDDDFRCCFHGVSDRGAELIRRIRDNDPNLTAFRLRSADARHLSASAWEAFGRFVRDNDQLRKLSLQSCGLNDSKASAFFGRLGPGGASALRKLDLGAPNDSGLNDFGAAGVRSMVPFLRNSNVEVLKFSGVERFCSESLRLLVTALEGSQSIRGLYLVGCSVEDLGVIDGCSLPYLRHIDFAGCFIQDIEVLKRCKFPRLEGLLLNNNDGLSSIAALGNYTQLKLLDLSGNDNIGKAGFNVIAELLQRENCAMNVLNVPCTGIGDAEVEILTRGLEHNRTLTTIKLEGNEEIGERGVVAFSRLLNDISTIERTANSNHILVEIGLDESPASSGDYMDISANGCISQALRTNARHRLDPGAAGRTKLVETQLDSACRMRHSILQGAWQKSCWGSDIIYLLANAVDSCYLPNVLALLGSTNDVNMFYRLLVETSSALPSLIIYEGLKKAELKNVTRTAKVLGMESLQLSTFGADVESDNSCLERLSPKVRPYQPKRFLWQEKENAYRAKRFCPMKRGMGAN
ncbi:hypothetical protein ACHAWF_015214 [Thalassiosira exigua]